MPFLSGLRPPQAANPLRDSVPTAHFPHLFFFPHEDRDIRRGLMLFDQSVYLWYPPTTMLKMRLQRIGRKNNPSYRVVVVDSRQGPKSGKYVDLLGSYSAQSDTVQIDGERAKEWIGKGVQVSGTVHNILVDEKIIDAKKVNVLPKKTPIVAEEEPKEEQAPEAPEESTESAEQPAEETTPEAAEEKTEEEKAPDETSEEPKEESEEEKKVAA